MDLAHYIRTSRVSWCRSRGIISLCTLAECAGVLVEPRIIDILELFHEVEVAAECRFLAHEGPLFMHDVFSSCKVKSVGMFNHIRQITNMGYTDPHFFAVRFLLRRRQREGRSSSQHWRCAQGSHRTCRLIVVSVQMGAIQLGSKPAG